MKPIKKTNYHHGDLRQSIIHAVAQIIKEKRGLHFQLKEVAELVGTSQPAIYKHFADKKQLLTEVAVAGYQLQSDFRDKALNDAQASPLAKIRAVGISYLEFAQSHSGYFLLIKSLETKEILSSKRYLALRKKTIDLVHSLTQQCIDGGLFRKLDLLLTVVALNSAVYGLAHLYITGQIEAFSKNVLDDEGFYQKVLNMHINAMLTEKGKIVFSKLK